MAYMRGDYYFWSDGTRLHVWVADGYDGWDQAGWAVDEDDKRSKDRLEASGVGIPEKVMDEFVVMRLAQMIDEGTIGDAIDRAISHNGGNVGCMMLEKNAQKLKEVLAKVKLDKSEQ
jgi:hypothetical protein